MRDERQRSVLIGFQSHIRAQTHTQAHTHSWTAQSRAFARARAPALNVSVRPCARVREIYEALFLGRYWVMRTTNQPPRNHSVCAHALATFVTTLQGIGGKTACVCAIFKIAAKRFVCCRQSPDCSFARGVHSVAAFYCLPAK